MLSHHRYYVYSSYAATLNLVQTLKKPFISVVWSIERHHFQ